MLGFFIYFRIITDQRIHQWFQGSYMIHNKHTVRLRKMININTKQMKLNLMNQDIQTSFEQNSWNLVRKHSHVH